MLTEGEVHLASPTTYRVTAKLTQYACAKPRDCRVDLGTLVHHSYLRRRQQLLPALLLAPSVLATRLRRGVHVGMWSFEQVGLLHTIWGVIRASL